MIKRHKSRKEPVWEEEGNQREKGPFFLSPQARLLLLYSQDRLAPRENKGCRGGCGL
jgi:hypothetical protein